MLEFIRESVRIFKEETPLITHKAFKEAEIQKFGDSSIEIWATREDWAGVASSGPV